MDQGGTQKRGWPQAQLAEVAGLSERTIQRIDKNGVASPDTLQALASAFETTVEHLSPSPEEKAKRKGPKIHFLLRLKTGQDVFANMGKMEMYQTHNDELKDESEVDLVGDFFQDISDFGDLWSDLEETEKVKFAFDFSKRIEELEDCDFLLFGTLRKVIYSASCVTGEKKNIPMEVAVFFIKRKDCPSIIRKTHGEELLPAIFK